MLACLPASIVLKESDLETTARRQATHKPIAVAAAAAAEEEKMDEQQQEQQAPCVPPGFRFHPTEEELVGYYLARKVASQKIDLDIIREVDLYRIEPWDLQERCGYYGGGQDHQEEPTEYYFFSYKDRKYPSGTRTNRATAAGFWKATGRDKPVLSSSGSGGICGGVVIGMRKTLVFYRGRAPNGRKTDWIIHEYRLQSNEHAPAQEEGWVVCRAFHKPMPNHHHMIRQPCFAAGYPPLPAAASYGGGTYYYDGPAAAGPAAAAARLLMNSGGAAAAAAAAPHSTALASPHDGHGGGLLAAAAAAAAESKLHVQLLADMPPLQSPSVVDVDAVAVQQHHHRSYSDDDQVVAAAVAAESSTVDWSLLSSLLPPAQLNFHHTTTPPPASPSSCSKNNNDA